MSFGKRLKKARQDKGLSQSQLGEIVGVHYTQIGRYEAKGVKPAGDILANIATALSVSSDFLISGTTNEMADASLSDKELLHQFKKAEQLNKEQKYILKELVDAYLLKCDIQKNFAKAK
jgi:transcriptional regulator with XRE-family HTH domain